MRNLTGLSWSPDGSYIVAMSCAGECLPFQRIDVPTTLGRPLVVRLTGPELYPVRLIRSASVAFGPDGLYTLEASVPVQGAAATRPTDQVQLVKAGTFDFAVPIFSGANEWTISQVVPTTAGTYVVATRVQRKGTPGAPATGLYLVRAGRLVLMRGLTEPGTLTPVPALRAAG